MLAFWLGTVPALLLAGTFAHKLIEWRSKKTFRRLGGAVMILLGVLALAPWWTQPAGHSHGAGTNGHALQNTLNARLRASRNIHGYPGLLFRPTNHRSDA